MDRLEQLSAFVEVARAQSFAQAARQLERHTSAVSRAVAALENRLGVRLLQRTTRRVTLSDAGRDYFKRCEALLAEFEGADAAVRDHAASLRGTLKVSVATGAGQTLLAPVLAEFLAAHLALRVGSLGSDSRLVVRRLAPSRRVLVASPGYVARRGNLRTPTELARHPCLSLDAGPRPRHWQLERGRARVAVDVSGPLRSNNSFALRHACRDGLGVSLLPQFVVASDLADGGLSHVLPGWSSAEQGIYAVYPSARFIPAKVRAFVDFVAARVRAAEAHLS
jgi:DNA-binding transcriptional LysR family regulator